MKSFEVFESLRISFGLGLPRNQILVTKSLLSVASFFPARGYYCLATLTVSCSIDHWSFKFSRFLKWSKNFLISPKVTRFKCKVLLFRIDEEQNELLKLFEWGYKSSEKPSKMQTLHLPKRGMKQRNGFVQPRAAFARLEKFEENRRNYLKNTLWLNQYDKFMG